MLMRFYLVYFGYILMYSRSDQYRELWLRDVEVFSNDSGNKLYEVDEVYVCANKTELTVEIPKGTSAEGCSVQKTKEKENGSKKSSQGCKTDDKEDQENSI